MTKSLIGFTLALFLPTIAGATTWYVAPTGNDGHTCAQAQSPATAKLTINAALACVGSATGAGAGDTVQVASGTYAETISSWPSGASGNPFVLRSATQHGAIIRPATTSSYILNFSSGYVTVEGFVVDGINVNAINILLNAGTREITIQNCEIKNTKIGDGTGPGSFQAIYGYDASYARFLNNRIHDIGIGATTHFNHGIYWSGSDSLFEGNTIYNVGGNAIQVYTAHGNTMGGNTIRNNKFYDFAAAGVGNGVYAAGTNNLVYNNIIYQTRTNPNAVGITLDGAGNQAYHNTVYNNGYIGLSIAGTGSIARNNIAFRNGTDVLPSGSQYVIDHNLTADPRFAALSAFDFNLSATSPAIDAGITVSLVATDVNGVPRPQAHASDIGAVEFSVGPVAPRPPSQLHIIRR